MIKALNQADIDPVYFIYPETAGVRLEDMDAIFGDATTAMPTPAARAETGSLMGAGSPVPSMDLRRGVVGAGQPTIPGIGASHAIPGFDIDPPHVSIVNGKPQFSADEASEGSGGWISRMVKKNKGETGSVRSGGSGSGRYKPLDQGDDSEV
jgi:hypothetical protein